MDNNILDFDLDNLSYDDIFDIVMSISTDHDIIENEIDYYDGIWACSSILHLSKDELKNVMQRMLCALKDDGVIYTSFKYGTFEGERNGRYFTDFTEKTFDGFLSGIRHVKIEEQWLTGDVRPGRESEQWLNLILRKV